MKFYKTRQKGYFDLDRPNSYKMTRSRSHVMKKEKIILKHQYRAVLKKFLLKEILGEGFND